MQAVHTNVRIIDIQREKLILNALINLHSRFLGNSFGTTEHWIPIFYSLRCIFVICTQKYPTYLQEEYNTVGKSYGTKGRCEPISLEGERKVHTIHGGINGYHDESTWQRRHLFHDCLDTLPCSCNGVVGIVQLFVVLDDQTEIGNKLASIVTSIFCYRNFKDRSLQACIQWWKNPLG